MRRAFRGPGRNYLISSAFIHSVILSYHSHPQEYQQPIQLGSHLELAGLRPDVGYVPDVLGGLLSQLGLPFLGLQLGREERDGPDDPQQQGGVLFAALIAELGGLRGVLLVALDVVVDYLSDYAPVGVGDDLLSDLLALQEDYLDGVGPLSDDTRLLGEGGLQLLN